MGSHFLAALAASLLASAITLIAILVVRYYRDWSIKNLNYFISFAAGLIITVSFLHIVPEAIHSNKNTPLYILVGYLLLYMVDRFVQACVCTKPHHQHYALGLIPVIGIGFHAFVDGLIYSVTFSFSLFTGVLTAVGMVMHKFPIGVIAYLLLLRTGMKQRTAFWLAFTAVGLTTPFATLISYPFISQMSTDILGALLAVSAGALIYVSATHLLPHAEQERKPYVSVSLFSGVALAIFIVLIY